MTQVKDNGSWDQGGSSGHSEKGQQQKWCEVGRMQV